MKLQPAAGIFFLGISLVTPRPEYFRYQRQLYPTPLPGGQSCAVLDPGIFAHAAAGLSDLRIYAADREVAYSVRGSEARSGSTSLALELMNKGESNGRTSLDAEMPRSRYDTVELMIPAKDFIASVTVWGSQEKPGAKNTRLGTFTVFDLSSQRLGHSAVLHLPTSGFQYLHFEITGALHPDQVTGAQLLLSQSAKPRYVTIASTSTLQRDGRSSLASFTLPANVPLDRIVVTPAAEPAQFSRTASVEVAPVTSPNAGEAPSSVSVESGQLIRVHSMQNGARIDREELALEAPYAYANQPRRVTVRIDNGDDPPLSLHDLRLEMTEQRVCFEATAGMQSRMVYGDPALSPAAYDYSRIFTEAPATTVLTTGPEAQNPAWKPRPDERAFTEKHPALLWIALLLAVGTLGWIAFRSFPAKNSDS